LGLGLVEDEDCWGVSIVSIKDIDSSVGEGLVLEARALEIVFYEIEMLKDAFDADEDDCADEGNNVVKISSSL